MPREPTGVLAAPGPEGAQKGFWRPWGPKWPQKGFRWPWGPKEVWRPWGPKYSKTLGGQARQKTPNRFWRPLGPKGFKKALAKRAPWGQALGAKEPQEPGARRPEPGAMLLKNLGSEKHRLCLCPVTCDL